MWAFCSFAKKHWCRLSPFLFLFALCEIMDVPVTPCHWIFTQRQLVTLPSWSQETWSSFSFIFTAFSNHCFFLSSMPYFQFPAVCYVTACPPTILCVAPYYSLSHLLPLHPFMDLALHPKCSQYYRWLQNFHFIVTKWNIFSSYFTFVLVEAHSLWKSPHVFCPFDHWIHDVSYLFEYALCLKQYWLLLMLSLEYQWRGKILEG